jgi:DHA1 family bicyclomycin/chloramphenicol resistance-like MFS transporter
VNPRDVPATEPPPTATIRPPPLWLLVCMVGSGPFALQMIVPLLPGFATLFGASVGAAQLLLTLALAGVAVGQLVYGPLSDRFGRRPVVAVALAIFLAASVAAALATSLPWLIVFRTIQAVGACGGMVIARAVIRDCFGRDKAASVLGYVMMGMTVAPMVAPFVASTIAAMADWHAVFALCAAMAAGLLWATHRHLPETLRTPQKLPGLGGMATMYGALLAVPAFRGFSATVAFSSGMFFTFIGGAPHIVVTGLGLPPSAYATAFLFTSGFFGLGNFLAGRYTQRVGNVRMIGLGTALAFLGAALALAAMLLRPPSILNLFVPSALMAVGNGISQSNAISAALSVRPQLAGTASGLTGFFQMAFGAVLSWVAGVIETGSGTATALMMLGCAAATQAVLAVMRAKRVG